MIVSASFNDYLYILFGVAWLIFSVYKGQKKKNAAASDQPKKTNKSFLDSLIEEINPEPAAQSTTPYGSNDPYAPVDEVEVDEYEQEIFSYDDAVEESNETETSGVYNQKEVELDRTTEAIENKNTDNQNVRYKSGFSLRNAVIYSEILKPRYF